MSCRSVWCALIVGLATIVAQGDEAKPLASFTLPDSTGKPWVLDQQTNKFTVIVFISCECPMSNAYVKALSELKTKYAEQGVGVVGIWTPPWKRSWIAGRAG